MKVSAIINTVNTYNSFINRISTYKKQQIYYDAFDDTEGINAMQTMIDEESYKLGQFLDTEV